MSFFTKLFGGNKANITCPRCLSTKTTVNDQVHICSECSYELPIRYVQAANTHMPIKIQVFGWTAHGKTAFLYTLRLMLLEMPRLWQNFTQQSITDFDLKLDRELRTTIATGLPPAPTVILDRRPEDVYLLQLDNMPRWGNKFLMMMDFAGEMFNKMDVKHEAMPYLIDSPTTFLLLSIPQIQESRLGESLDQLVNIYINTMLRIREVDFRKKRREVVIILTMADKMMDHLPSEIKNYLLDDTLWRRLRTRGSHPMDLHELDAYIHQMHVVDSQIRTWLKTDAENAPGGANMLGLLDQWGIKARFSIISAYGHETDDNAPTPITPYRVLDPFFWALEFQKGAD